jgi:hypothetical protein
MSQRNDSSRALGVIRLHMNPSTILEPVDGAMLKELQCQTILRPYLTLFKRVPLVTDC